MTDILQEHWGDLFSAAGFFFALWAALSARSAKNAANEARDRIVRSLGVVDLERAIALIQHLKLLHREGRWEAALEQYQTLRAMVSTILSRYPDWDGQTRSELVESRIQITFMERHVESVLPAEGLTFEDSSALNERLNDIQATLEDRASDVGFGSE